MNSAWQILKDERAELREAKSREAKLSIKTIFVDLRYRGLTIFLLIACVIN